jgi:hypothetical protein
LKRKTLLVTPSPQPLRHQNIIIIIVVVVVGCDKQQSSLPLLSYPQQLESSVLKKPERDRKLNRRRD